MEIYLYLSLLPEALIASHLPPQDFGNYMAVGSKKRTRGEAIFFQVSRDFKSDSFPLDKLDTLCVPHPNGDPKRSKYLSIYRVLERVPLSALMNLYLVTDDGRVLELSQGAFKASETREFHMYQQLSPVNPTVVSSLDPREFTSFLTDPASRISVPTIVFCELTLEGLASDPVFASVEDLPYKNLDHLRDCLVGLQERPEKSTKTVNRTLCGELLYRTVKNGFFVGNQKRLLYYPFPSRKELEDQYYAWWRSALTLGF
jgi:hypothetical protein